MERTFRHSIWLRLGGLLLLVISLSAGRTIVPGEIVMQEGVAYRQEGRQLQSVGDLESAAAAYQKAISVKPDYAEAYNDLGVILESLGKPDRAEEMYKTALRYKPDLAAAHSNLALLYEETSRVKEAANHWAARVQLGSFNDPWAVKAREKLTKHNLPIPETREELAVKHRSEAQKALLAGRAHMDNGRWDEAAQDFRHALELDPSNGHTKKLLQVTQARASKEQARIAKGLKPAKHRAKKVQARGKKKQKKAPMTEEAAKEEALRQAEEMLKAQEEKAPSASTQAQSLAQTLAKERSQVRQRSTEELYHRALTAMREGRYQDAREQFKQILTLDPSNPEARQGLERAEKALARAK